MFDLDYLRKNKNKETLLPSVSSTCQVMFLIESEPNRHRCGMEIKNTSQGKYNQAYIHLQCRTKWNYIAGLRFLRSIVFRVYSYDNKLQFEMSQRQPCSEKIW
jgi:hypothetical protein